MPMDKNGLETAGFEPASCNTHLQRLHACPLHFIQVRIPGRSAVLGTGSPFVSPLRRERARELSSVSYAAESPRGADPSATPVGVKPRELIRCLRLTLFRRDLRDDGRSACSYRHIIAVETIFVPCKVQYSAAGARRQPECGGWTVDSRKWRGSFRIIGGERLSRVRLEHEFVP